MLIKEEVGRQEMLGLLAQLYQKMQDSLQNSGKALVEFEFENDSDQSLRSCSIRSLTDSGYSDQSLYFGFLSADIN